MNFCGVPKPSHQFECHFGLLTVTLRFQVVEYLGFRGVKGQSMLIYAITTLLKAVSADGNANNRLRRLKLYQPRIRLDTLKPSFTDEFGSKILLLKWSFYEVEHIYVFGTRLFLVCSFCLIFGFPFCSSVVQRQKSLTYDDYKYS